MKATSYYINEIFHSIEGEGKRAGQLATFIRFAGCNLRCSYCDTGYALTTENAKLMTVKEIVKQVKTYDKVTITGGEPLLQNLEPLLDALREKYADVNIETNGSLDITRYFGYDDVFFTIDYKCRSSHQSGAMLMRNFKAIRGRDVVKFVVGTHEDLAQAKTIYHECGLVGKQIYISPVFKKIRIERIVEFMKIYDLQDWRLQLQLHKYIWDPQKRGV